MKSQIDIEKIWENYLNNKNKVDFDKIIEYYFDYVEDIAKKLANKLDYPVDYEDLKSYGLDGLRDAVVKYDTSKKTKFKSYAYIRIRGSMIDGLRAADWVPVSVKRNFDKFKKNKKQLEVKLGRHITDEEVLEHMGVDINKKSCYNGKYIPVKTVSIENPNHDAETSCSLDSNFSNNKLDFHKNLISDEKDASEKIKKEEFLKVAINENLSSEEKEIIQLHYFQNVSVKDIAKQKKKTKKIVEQLHLNALAKIKENLQSCPEYAEAIF